jgi:hypothetical protein
MREGDIVVTRVARHYALILFRPRKRSRSLRLSDRMVALAFGIPINKDVVRRILDVRYQSGPNSAGPSWLTALGA